MMLGTTNIKLFLVVSRRAPGPMHPPVLPSSAYRAFRLITHSQLVSRFHAVTPAFPHRPTSWCHDAQGQLILPNKLQDTIYRPTDYLAEGRLRNRKWTEQPTPKTPCPCTKRHDIMLISTAARTSNLEQNLYSSAGSGVPYRTQDLDREEFRTENRPCDELFVGRKTTFCAYVKAEHGWNNWASGRRVKASRIIIRSLIIIICTNENGRHFRRTGDLRQLGTRGHSWLIRGQE